MNYSEFFNRLEAPTGFERLFLLVISFCIAVWAITTLFSIIGKWKMFTKAGREGWPAVVPVYDTIVLCEISGINSWWVAIIIAMRLLGGLLVFIALPLAALISIYFKVILYVSIARSYGKSDVWAIGIYFLKPFFLFALGVGDSKYQGPKPLEDPILEAIGINPPTKKETVKEEKIICKNCGEENLNTSKFCTSCGKKL